MELSKQIKLLMQAEAAKRAELQATIDAQAQQLAAASRTIDALEKQVSDLADQLAAATATAAGDTVDADAKAAIAGEEQALGLDVAGDPAPVTQPQADAPAA